VVGNLEQDEKINAIKQIIAVFIGFDLMYINALGKNSV